METEYEKALKLLGSRIRALRTQRKFTQQHLGEKAGISYKFLGEIERGQQNPSFQILLSLASALEVDPAELLRYEHEVPTREQAIKAIVEILPKIPDDHLQSLLLILQALYP